MSLKNIEMQIAIPRTKDAGNLQNQLNQKPAEDQRFIAESLVKTAAKQRQRSGQVDQTSDVTVRNQEKREQTKKDGQRKKKSGNNRQDSAEKSSHPYKGQHIDLTF